MEPLAQPVAEPAGGIGQGLYRDLGVRIGAIDRHPDPGLGQVGGGVHVGDRGEPDPGIGHVALEDLLPLVEAGLTKLDVRRAARDLELSVWDKPAAPCLASRVPYGTEVSVGVLGQVERAEHALRALGFGDLRVRHYDDLARLEVPVADLDLVVARRDAVVAAVRAAGYRYVTLDLEGLRSGNLNDALPRPPSS